MRQIGDAGIFKLMTFSVLHPYRRNGIKIYKKTTLFRKKGCYFSSTAGTASYHLLLAWILFVGYNGTTSLSKPHYKNKDKE